MLRRIAKKLSAACIVDTVLIVYMLILLSYMTARLFIGVGTDGSSNVIDIVIRTSAAGVFGYFISRNFGRRSNKTSLENIDAVYQKSIDGDSSGQIGFQVRDRVDANAAAGQSLEGDTSVQTGKISGYQSAVPSTEGCDRVQVVVVSVIGLFSLIVLLVARQFYSTSTEFTAIVSQLRDFFSASIGFLISCGKGTSE